MTHTSRLLLTAAASAVLFSSCNSNERVDLRQKVDEYAVVKLSSPLMETLSDKDKQVLNLFRAAAVVADGLFWQQTFGDKALMENLENQAAKDYAMINYGPWDRLDDNSSFVEGYGEKPAGANYYPHDITPEEFAAFADPDKNSQYTVLRRDESGNLKCVWYRDEYRASLDRICKYLEEAAMITENEGLKNYLLKRVKAFRTDDYYESDLGVDRVGTITFRNELYDVTVEVKVRQSPVVPEGPDVPGISTGADLNAFVQAVNTGSSTSRWENEAGEVVLLNDIDISAMTEWTPIGTGTASGNPAYTLTNPFTGVFNGQGFAITGINWTYDVTKSHLFGFFGALQGATVKNLTLGKEGDQITVVGATMDIVSVGALAGYAESSTITGVTNNVSVILADKNAAVPGDCNALMMLGGIAGTVKAPMTMGGRGDDAVKNYGNVKTGTITNTANGGTGMQVAGIVAFTVGVNDVELKIDYCDNYGEISAPAGRGGGLVGTLGGSTSEVAVTVVSNCTNYGLIQDDEVGQFAGDKSQYDRKRMGGLVGGTVTNNKGIRIEYCTNNGNVFSHIGCRTGGFVGHNQATITGCVNKGVILSNITANDKGEPQHGPGWACGFNGNKSLITNCAKGGRVGDWDTYKDNPSAAPEASNDNAVCYMSADRYDPSLNN